MAESKKYYRPGLEFKARKGALCHQECCFPGTEEVRNADGSLRTEAIRPLWAEFGMYGEERQRLVWNERTQEFDPVNDMFDGRPLFTADIRGGWFDLDTQAEQKQWSESEKEIVAEHMLKKLREPDCEFTLVERREVQAPAPWPTYDQTHHKSVVALASQLGLVREALAYEVQNKNRDGVVAELRAALDAPTPVDDESLAAA